MVDEEDLDSGGGKSTSGKELELSVTDTQIEDEEDDSSSDDEDEEESSDSITNESMRFNTQFSLHKCTKLIQKLTDAQRKLICDIKFGSVLELKCTIVPPQKVIVWLAMYYDEKTQCIRLPGTRPFKLDALTVYRILGIPYGGAKIKSKASNHAKSIVGNDTVPGKLAPKIEEVIAMITPDVLGDRFVRLFMLALLSIFLCPTSSTRVNCHYYEGIVAVKKIKNYDWCDAVISSLTSGLSKFQKYAARGNTCGKATLSGCVFVLFTAFFDYLVIDSCIVPQTIPHIVVWTDELVQKYMQLEPKFKSMQINKIDCTIFGKADFKRKTRSSNINATNEAGASGHAAGPSLEHMPSKKLKKVYEEAVGHDVGPSCDDMSFKRLKKTTNFPSHGLFNEKMQIDRDSVERVIPDCSDSAFRVFCGEELHPEVDKFIRSNSGINCTNEVLLNMRKLCKNFFRDSFRQYIGSVEQVLVSQSCALVTSFLPVLQQSQTGGSEKKFDDVQINFPFTEGLRKMSIHSNKIDGDSSGGKDHLSSSNLDTSGFAKFSIDTHLGDSTHFEERAHEIFTNPDANATKDMQNQDEEQFYGACTDSHADTTKSFPNQTDKEGGTASISEIGGASKQLPFQDDQDKKVAADDHTDKNDAKLDDGSRKTFVIENADGSSVHSLQKENNSSSNAETTDGRVDDLTTNETAASPKKKQKPLSALGHKKHAVKAPISNFTNILNPSSRVHLTELEKNVYHEACRRPRGFAQKSICADIGRMNITHMDFADTMAGSKWVGTFVMNVFCEALNYDMRESAEQTVKKCYLTSAEVDNLKVPGIGIDLLMQKLDPTIVSFNITKMDMVFMPICDGNHWWLLVANIRDNRFDILSSLAMRDHENKITQSVRTNFEMAFARMKDEEDVVDLQIFPSSIHNVPRQQTINDCGIYVMNFMVLWDDRQIPPFDSSEIYNHRVRFGAFMLTHRGNVRTLAAIEKLLNKNKLG